MLVILVVNGVGGSSGGGGAQKENTIRYHQQFCIFCGRWWRTVPILCSFVLSDLMVYPLQLYGIVLRLEFLCAAIFILYIRIINLMLFLTTTHKLIHTTTNTNKIYRSLSKHSPAESRHSTLNPRIRYWPWNRHYKRRRVFKLIKSVSSFLGNNYQMIGHWNHTVSMQVLLYTWYYNYVGV